MIVIAGIEEYMKEVEAFADKTQQRESLDKSLVYLGEYAGGTLTRCTLYKDFAPASFAFVMERRKDVWAVWTYWFNGGLIYHGEHDGWGSGAAPTLAVCVNPTGGWNVHT